MFLWEQVVERPSLTLSHALASCLGIFILLPTNAATIAGLIPQRMPVMLSPCSDASQGDVTRPGAHTALTFGPLSFISTQPRNFIITKGKLLHLWAAGLDCHLLQSRIV